MNGSERQRLELGAAVRAADGLLAAADRLYRIRADLLKVDGASVSVMHDGTTRGTFGSSGKRGEVAGRTAIHLWGRPCPGRG